MGEPARGGCRVELHFKKSVPGLGLKATPAVVLVAGFTEKLELVFQEFAQRDSSTESAGGSNRSAGGDSWRTLRFLALGQAAYLSPNQTPKSALLGHGHVIRVSAPKARSSSRARQSATQPTASRSTTLNHSTLNQAASSSAGLPSWQANEATDSEGPRSMRTLPKEDSGEPGPGSSRDIGFLPKGGAHLEEILFYTRAIIAEGDSLLYCKRSGEYLELAQLSMKEELTDMALCRAVRDALWAQRVTADDPNADLSLACCLEVLGFPDEALHFCKKALEEDPWHAGSQRKKDLMVMKASGKPIFSEAWRNHPILLRARAASTVLPSDEQLNSELEWAARMRSYRQYWDEGQKQELKNLEREAADLKARGNAFYKEGNYVEAALLYTRALQEDPIDGVLHSNRGSCFFEMAKNPPPGCGKSSLELLLRAQMDLEWCVEAKCTWAKGFYKLGCIEMELGRPATAKVYFDDAIRRNPGLKEAKEKLNECAKRHWTLKDAHTSVLCAPNPVDFQNDVEWLEGLLQLQGTL